MKVVATTRHATEGVATRMEVVVLGAHHARRTTVATVLGLVVTRAASSVSIAMFTGTTLLRAVSHIMIETRNRTSSTLKMMNQPALVSVREGVVQPGTTK